MSAPASSIRDSTVLEQDKNQEHGQDDCFYNLCTKTFYCNGKMICGIFKTQRNRVFCFFMSVMTVALFLSIIFPLILYKIADDGVNDEVVIDSPKAKNFDIWRTNTEGKGAEDYHVHYDLYYFDLQNPVQVLAGEKPIVAEVGPYAYNEYFNRFDISWSDDGDTVTFYNQRYYVFDQARSGPGLSQTDKLTLPYATVSGFQYILDQVPYNVTVLVGEAIDSVLLTSLHQIEGQITRMYNDVVANDTQEHGIRHAQLVALQEGLQSLNSTVKEVYASVFAFTAQSNPLDLFLKVMLCGTPEAVSPFFRSTPGPAWFGWLRDPLLLQVSKVIAAVAAKNPDMPPVAWTTAVPGVTINFTSPEEVRRRVMPNTFKTGKRNSMQVGQYVKYNGMRAMYNCILPMKSQDPGAYVEGEQAPACAHFDESWTHEEAVEAGYTHPFGSDYANRIQGTDGNLFGRPVRTEKLQIFSYDIYRSGFMQYKQTVTDWHGVELRRFGIQAKDMFNASLNAENDQFFAWGISGVENLTQALNVPIFASFPHFLYGDPRLVEAVVGMHPKEAAHNSEVDLEPQTGLIARAAKRIQVNYRYTSRRLPVAANDTLSTVQGVCGDMQDALVAIASLGVDTNVTVSCNLTVVTPLMECLAAPGTWDMYGNELYIPYGWVHEGIVMPKSTADQLQSSLFVVDDIAAGARFWCLVVAGLCFAVLATMAWSAYTEVGTSSVDTEYRKSLPHLVFQPLMPSSPV